MAAWYWRELRFAYLYHEPACENYLDCAYSVIDGQFFKDELVTLKLCLDDSAALQVIFLANKEGSVWFAGWDAENWSGKVISSCSAARYSSLAVSRVNIT